LKIKTHPFDHAIMQKSPSGFRLITHGPVLCSLGLMILASRSLHFLIIMRPVQKIRKIRK
jgi:hypothetical protein